MTESSKRITNGPLPREVFVFGLPLVVGMALHASFNLIDMFIIGRLPNGTAALGALAVSDMLAILATIICNGMSNATVAVVSRRHGSGDFAGMNHAAWSSVGVITVLSLVFGLAGVFGAEWVITDMVGTKGEVRVIAIDYLQIIMGGSASIFFLLQLTAIMRGLGESRFPAMILVGSNILNIILDIIMAYGPGPAPEAFAWATPFAAWLGVPHMGVNGAAWATVISRTLGSLVAFVWLVRRDRNGLRFQLKDLIPRKDEVMRLVKIGLPSSGQFVVRVLGVLVFVSLVARFFTTPEDGSALAAFGICIRLDTIALFTGLGWGAAASTFIGQNLGAGYPDRAVRAGWLAAGYNVLLMIGLASFYLVYAPGIIGFFNDAPQVIDIGREYLRIVGVTYAFIGIAAVLSSGLSGAGATLSSFLIDAVVLLGVQIPVSIFLIGQRYTGRVGTWWLIAIGNILSALVYIAWYNHRSWLRKQI